MKQGHLRKYPDEGLRDPVRSFEDTFDAWTLLIKKYFKK